jgi:hypothetical protein
MLLLEWSWYWHVIELSVVLFSNYFAFTAWIWFVITMWTSMYVSYLWTICEMGCNMWLVMLNHVWSWLYVGDLKSFVVSSDYRFIWAQVWQFDHFSDCYCTCALINWTVLLQKLLLMTVVHAVLLNHLPWSCVSKVLWLFCRFISLASLDLL